MRRWSEVAERVAATTRTSAKTAVLADYLAGLAPNELPIAAVFLTGRPFAEADQRAAGLGWSAIATTVSELADVPSAADHAPDPATSPTLPEVAAAYGAIEAASGPAAKGAILRDLFRRSD